MNSRPANYTSTGLALLLGAVAGTAAGQQTDDKAAELAKQLANPVASLISVPIQVNYDDNFGPEEEGSVIRTNVQPVIPIELNDDWNVISRTILPLIDQEDVPSVGIDEFGLGDTVQSLFFSPKAPTASGWIWGAGLAQNA